eukprot:6468357-Amphidinium_carterae.1
MSRQPQDGAVGTSQEALLPGSSLPSWGDRMLAKASCSTRRDLFGLSDLPLEHQFNEPEYCCVECNEVFSFYGASALRGQCTCGGEIDHPKAKHGKASGVSNCEHAPRAVTAPATSSVAATGVKVLWWKCRQYRRETEAVASAVVAETASVALPRIPGNSPRAGRMPVQPRLRATSTVTFVLVLLTDVAGQERDEEASGCEPGHGEGCPRLQSADEISALAAAAEYLAHVERFVRSEPANMSHCDYAFPQRHWV